MNQNNDVDLNGTFKRSLSVPAAVRRKNNKTMLTCTPGGGNVVNGNARLNRICDRHVVSGKKRDIRVSRFDPAGIDLPFELLKKINDAGSHSEVGKSNIRNGSAHDPLKPMTSNDKVERRKETRIVRKLISVRRMASFTNRSPKNCCIKTVEIKKEQSETLGIFIKKRKISRGTDLSVLPDGTRCKEGIFISRLEPKCKAAVLGLVNPGDQLLAINTVEVSHLSVQMVAAIMAIVQHMSLTIRTPHSNENGRTSSNHVAVTPVENSVKSTNKPRMDVLPEDIVVESNGIKIDRNSNLSRVKVNNSAVKSVYDNTVQNTTMNETHTEAPKIPPKESKRTASPKVNSESKLNEKFDESFQILLEAIACLDKPNNTNNNSSLKTPPLPPKLNPKTKPQETTNENGQRSLLEEILSTVKSNSEEGRQWTSYVSSQNEEDHALDLGMADTVSLHEPDYDEVADSDDESSLSSSGVEEEVSVDAYSQPLRDASGSSSSSVNSSLNAESAEILLNHQNTARRSHSIDGANLSELNHRNNINHQDPASGKYNIPPFPTPNFDRTSDTQPKNTPSVTVDKRREWLNRGTKVSQELQSRLDGTSQPTNNLTKRKNSLDLNLENQKPSNQKWFPRSTSKRTTSESSSGSNSNASNSPNTNRTDRKNSLKGILKGSSEKNESLTKMQKSPSEKSAKRLLSVNSPSSPLHSKTKFFPTPEQSSDVKESKDMKELSTDTTSKELSPEWKDKKESVNHNKNEASGSKVTSPGRMRKKNWGMKIMKQFKMIRSSSDNASEYRCWVGDEQFDEQFGRGVNPLIRNVTQHNIHKNIDSNDSAILNRYHLDMSMAQQRRLSRQLLLDNTNTDPSIKPLNLSQFQKYKPLPMVNTQLSTAVDGCLVLTLYGVRELKKTLCEAYCLVQVDDAKTKRIGTTMQTCRGAVAWNQCFEMTVNQARELHLVLYTWEMRGGKQKVCSHATLNLAHLMHGKRPRDMFSERLAVRLEPRGTLYIKIGLEHNSSSTGPLVFGADLQSIVDRENKSLGIPSLVNSCIHEVEERGMQVVGVYRLCGSAIVKKNLRSELEASKNEVKLTAEQYPDVNVITGILKDFLRELPQPLFPPELLEAVTTAMENNPGPTPVPAVKEPFAPNPSLISGVELPLVVEEASEEQKLRTDALLKHIHGLSTAPAEQATLYALLNHLKRVSMHAHQNKMTCQNLAVCFGPVLLGPVNVGPTKGIDLSAAIGFKRHIQVLNYMLSNWPDTPVLPPSDINAGDNKRASQRMSCVSLTRRLSRVSVMEEDGGEDETIRASNDRATLVSLGRSESLNSILETEDNFTDPNMDYASNASNGFADFAASLV
uniref:rho GTPase-activating protein SYDE2 isoform X3 n=1 Tax=Ciona intestinalis TaxID=7719 RepID=UPI000180BDAF|nr:rho GTPase-activating protein SYDE2 isoform X3 [Ciona intestinalis]|eukprot:XP_018671147.1 rho GTPase-activating protein SYDE2 isoform X3 [Ciona intestinalis]